MTKHLPELPVEMKALNTAALLFTGIALLMALAYVDISHRGVTRSYWIAPANIAATYYGPGVSVATLIDLAHIHMLGLLAVFWIIGHIFVHSSYAPAWKAFWSALPFAAFVADIAGWFLTKLEPGFVYLVIVGGGLFVLALPVMILLSLYDIWLTPVFHRRARAARAAQAD